MRISTLSFATLVAVPSVAFALTIQPANLYPDVRASNPESAGIHMLSREGIVQGYGSGFFGTSRQINRAEFLKTAMKALALHPDVSLHPEFDTPEIGEPTDPFCFDDVRIGDWFSPAVCYAFSAGIVKGNPDGLFHPERTVSYGEALKMLTLAFGYDVQPVWASHWAEAYYRAAASKHVDLPVTITLDTPLTRGLAARLIAAFVAESEGQLQELRYAEAGVYSSSSSSSSASSVSSSSSSVSSSVVSSSSSSSAALFTLPPVSHFLVAGQRSDAIASLTLHSTGAAANIVAAQVKLFSEVTSVEVLELVRADNGSLVATLNRRTTTDITDYKLTYEAQIPLGQQQIPADTDVPLVLRAKIRSAENNGASDQLLQVRTFNVTFHSVASDQTTNVPGVAPFPKHQTSFGKMMGVKRVSPVSSPIVSGTGLVLSAFSFSGTAIAGRSLALDELVFSLLKTGSVSVTGWSIGIAGSAASLPCSLSQDSLMLTCSNLSSLATLSPSLPLTLEIRANVFVPKNSTDSMLELGLANPGTPENLGSVRWTDQSGHFRWIESSSPIARGTRWQ